MADDIVNTVRLEGAEEAEAQFKSLADTGTASMQQLAGSTAPANKEIEAVGKHIEGLARKFGDSIRETAGAASKFVSNVTRMVGTVSKFAAAAGLGAAALKKFSNANEGTAAETKEAIAQSRLQTRSFAEGQIQALQNAKAIRDLNAQFASGKISMTDWAKAHQELMRTQAEEKQLAQQTALIRSAEIEDKERASAALKKQAAQQKAYADAVKSYGADAAGAMMALAPAWDGFMAKMNQGPSLIGDIMRGLTRLFNTHGTEIVRIFDRIGNAFASLFTGDGGDFATDFSEAIMTGIRGVAFAIENILIPVVKGIVKVFDGVAWAINAVFGTKVTGGVLAAAAALVVYAGGLTLIYRSIMMVIRGVQLFRAAMTAMGGASALLNPYVIIIAAIIAAIVLLVIHWDTVKAAVMAVVDAASAYLAKMRDDLIATGQQIKDAWNTVKTFFTDLWNAIYTAAADLWTRLKADWNASVQQFKDAWGALVTFFTDLWAQIKQLAVDAWNGFVAAASAALEKVKDLILSLIPGARQLLAVLKAITAEQAKAGESEGAGKKMGGAINGPGTSTSDSVPIRASRGEWVIQAKAVQYYGRSFMSALNSMRLPRGFDMSAIADALVVTPPRARFATGGEVGSRKGDGRPVILQFADGRTFAMTASNETADNLGRYATTRRLAGAGRKPSYFGGP